MEQFPPHRVVVISGAAPLADRAPHRLVCWTRRARSGRIVLFRDGQRVAHNNNNEAASASSRLVFLEYPGRPQ